jgi:hypothetical protein
MGQDDGKKFDPKRPPSIPPELRDLDGTWDDDLPDPFEGSRPPDDSDFDRPTPIVEIPFDLLNTANAPTERPPPGSDVPAESDVPARTGQTLTFAPDSEVPSLPPEPPPPAEMKPVRGVSEGSFPVAGIESLNRTIPYGEAPDPVPPPTGPNAQDRTIPYGEVQAPARAAPTPERRAGRVPTADLRLELDDPLGAESPLELADSMAPEPPSSPTSSPISAADLLRGHEPTSKGPAHPDLTSSGRPRPQPHLPAAPVSTPADEAVQMHDRFAAGDYSGALVLAEGILETDAGNQEAERLAEKCREVLAKMYLARIGSLDQVVKVIVADDQIRWLSLDHRAGFLLSLADGMSRVEDLLDISGMPRLDALRILFTLLEQGAISLE